MPCTTTTTTTTTTVSVYVRYESVVFLVMYAVYIVLMYFNRHIEAWVSIKLPCLGPSTEPKHRKDIDSVDLSEDMTADNNNELNNDIDDNDSSTLCLLLLL